MKKYFPATAVFLLFALLLLFSPDASDGARQGLSVCGRTLIPALFPLFVLSALLSELGFPELLAELASPVTERLFHVSGAGAQAFLLGLCGGYPLGASVLAELYRQGRLSREETERLLPFCNNSGPAFILGAAGGVLHSITAGVLLYVTHILGAVCVGLLMRPAGSARADTSPGSPKPMGQALPNAVTASVRAVLNICGYVVLFSALLRVLTARLSLPPLMTALVTGVIELGSGIAAMNGLSPTPTVLACAAFMLGFGGISVQFQTAGLFAGTDIKCARHLAGRALCGIFAAVFTYAGATLLQLG